MTKKKIFVKIKIPPPYDKKGKEVLVKGSSCAQLMHLEVMNLIWEGGGLPGILCIVHLFSLALIIPTRGSSSYSDYYPNTSTALFLNKS